MDYGRDSTSLPEPAVFQTREDARLRSRGPRHYRRRDQTEWPVRAARQLCLANANSVASDWETPEWKEHLSSVTGVFPTDHWQEASVVAAVHHRGTVTVVRCW
jgi:hypothetical protein